MAAHALARSYTDKDFDSLRARLVGLIRSVFPHWTNTSVANFGNILFELWAFVGDGIAFSTNKAAQESRITTATQRRNLLALVKLINYTPALAEAATAEETFTATGLVDDCTIPAGQVIKTKGDNPVEFQLLAPVHLTIAQPSAVGTLEHSKTHSQTYAGTGKADQTVELGEPGFLKIVSVTGASSGAWSRADGDNFLFTSSSDKVFTISVDNNDKATMKFSNGIAGQIPSDNLTIVYKTGGGAEGNVAPHSLTEIDGIVLDDSSNVVDLTADNADGASGGEDRETAASIKVNAPVSIRTPRTAVGREDFEDLATTKVGGITRALMVNTDIDPSIERNTGKLFLVPTGTAPTIPFANKARCEETKDLFISRVPGVRAPYPAPQTFKLTVVPAVYLDLSFYAKIYLRRLSGTPEQQAAARATIRANILQALIDYFNPVLADGTPNPLINFGYYLRQRSGNDALVQGELPLSDVQNAIRDVEGVLKIGPAENDFTVTGRSVEHDLVSGVDTTTVMINGAHADISMADTWFPRLRVSGGVPDVTLINGDTGAPL